MLIRKKRRFTDGDYRHCVANLNILVFIHSPGDLPEILNLCTVLKNLHGKMHFVPRGDCSRMCTLNLDLIMQKGRPDSLVVRASALGAVGRGFAPRSHLTKGVKNGTSSSLADACIKRVVLGR